MKLFGKKAPSVADFITHHKQEVMSVWVTTPSIFFHYVKTPQDLLLVFDRVSGVRGSLKRFILEAFQFMANWEFSDDAFFTLVSWFDNPLELLSVMAQNPNWLIKQLKTSEAKGKFLTLIETHAAKKTLADQFFSILISLWLHEDTTDLPLRLAMTAQSKKCELWLGERFTATEWPLPKSFSDSKWMAFWPRFVSLVNAESLQQLFSKMSSVGVDCLPVFEPVLTINPDLIVPLLAHFKLQKSKPELRYCTKFLIEKLFAQSAATLEQKNFFEKTYLNSSKNFPKMKVEHHILLIALFPNKFEFLSAMFFDEAHFHSLKLTRERFQELAKALPSPVRGLFLLNMLEMLKKYKEAAFDVTDQTFLITFCCEQIGAEDASLAFYICENHWEDTLKWTDWKREQLIAKCSDMACNSYATQLDNQNHARLSHFILTKQLLLTTLLMNRLVKRTIKNCMDTNPNELYAFVKQENNAAFLEELLPQLIEPAYLQWVTCFKPNVLFLSEMATFNSRFILMLLSSDSNIESNREFQAYLQQWHKEIFDYFMNSKRYDILFLEKTRQNKNFYTHFEKDINPDAIEKELDQRIFQIELENSNPTLQTLRRLLQIWQDRPVATKSFYRKKEVPKFIIALSKLLLHWQQTPNYSSHEMIDENQEIVLRMMIRDWGRERYHFDVVTQNCVDKIVGLLKMSKPFLVQNAAVSIKPEPEKTSLEKLQRILKELRDSKEYCVDEYTLPIQAFIYIETHMNEVLSLFLSAKSSTLYIPQLGIPLHTNYVDAKDTEGYKAYLYRFINNFLGAYEFAKSKGKLPDFLALIPGGVCLDARMQKPIEWAVSLSEELDAVDLHEFIAKCQKEAIAYADVFAVKEKSPAVSSYEFAQFVLEHHGVRTCKSNEILPGGLIDQKAIEAYAINHLALEPPAKQSHSFMNYFSK